MSRDPRSALQALIEKWREQARKDARYGVTQSMTSDREYYGTVNAGFESLKCADELAAVLASWPPDPPAIDPEELRQRLTEIEHTITDIRRRNPPGKASTLGVNWNLIANDLEFLLPLARSVAPPIAPRLVIAGTCRHDAPHYCANCGNSFTALEAVAPPVAVPPPPPENLIIHRLMMALNRARSNFGMVAGDGSTCGVAVADIDVVLSSDGLCEAMAAELAARPGDGAAPATEKP